MPAHRLTAALTLGVGATLAVTDVALSAHLTRAVEAERVHELEVVSRQVRAVATGLTPELGSRRAASAASEGLEAAYSGGWRWLELAAADELLSPAERDLLRRGELVLRRSAPDGLLMLTALPQESEGDRLVLELKSSLSGTRPESTNALLFGSLLGIGLVSTIAATLGHLLVTRPLRRISAFVQRVESGDRATRLAEDGAGEVALLERALNRLCERLDATDRSLREQVRAAAKTAEDLRHADRLASVGKLSAGIAHELGTPLNVILVRAKAIARAPDDPAEIARQAGIVATQAERLIKIVRGLLDFSRRRPPHLASVDVGDVVRGVVGLLEPQARGADVELRSVVSAPLPPVQADAGQLEQVLTNLIMNAVQASPGGGEVSVRCAPTVAAPPADREGQRGPATSIAAVRIDVTDRGVGITREDQARLFEPFFTTKQPGEGTGLGLSVAWGIVREHGGWIEVDSRESEGSCFSVFLPVVGPTPAEVKAAP